MHPRLLLVLTICATALGAPPGDEALSNLIAGNARFRSGSPTRPHQSLDRRKETAAGQHPFAAILSCADSRVAPELVFDQGIGDLFVVRVAGNVARADETASIEYGVEHLGAPLIVVMGHSACGAVTAVVQGAHGSADLAELLHPIAPAVERVRTAHPELSGSPLVAAAIEANVWLAMESLFKRSAVLRDFVRDGKLKVVGAVYDLASGQVHFLGQHPDQARLLATASTP